MPSIVLSPLSVWSLSLSLLGFLGSAVGRESACQCRRHKRCGFHPWVGKIPWRRKWQPTPVLLPGKSHGWRSLGSYSHRVSKSQTRLSSTQTHVPSIVLSALPVLSLLLLLLLLHVNAHKKPVRWVLLLSSLFYKWGNWGIERLNNFPKVTPGKHRDRWYLTISKYASRARAFKYYEKYL